MGGLYAGSFEFPSWRAAGEFPLFFNADGRVMGPAIYHFQQVKARGVKFWLPLVFAIGLAEAYRVSIGWANPSSKQFNTLRKDYSPGKLGFDALWRKSRWMSKKFSSTLAAAASRNYRQSIVMYI